MLLLLLACHKADSNGGLEALRCDDPNPSSAWNGEAVYVERTAEWGLTGVTGGRLGAADLNGDGFPELVVSELFNDTRDDFGGETQIHFVGGNTAGETGRTFADITESSGLFTNREGGSGRSSNLHIFGDVDGDGDLDAYAGRFHDHENDTTGDRSEILLNDGAGNFGLAEASDPEEPDGYPTAGASFTDYDGDGVLDLWVTGWYVAYGASLASAQAELYRGKGDGRFERVTEEMGLELNPIRDEADYLERDTRHPAYGATACDVNNDSLPDLIATHYARAWNQLWRNDGDRFVEIGEDAHFDGDTNLDYSDNERYACYVEVYGGGALAPTVDCPDTSIASYWSAGFDDQPGRLNGNSFTTACGDIDNDGDLDLYTTEIAHRWAGGSSDGSQLLLNDGDGVFERVDNETNGLVRERPRRGDWNEGDIHVLFYDFDNDGWRDILLASTDYEDTRLWLWRQVEPGEFEEVGEAAGLDQPWPGGLVAADFDLDGDLDVVTGSSTARTGTPWTTRELHFYENQSAAGNWLRLAGLPVGTRVEVEADGVTSTAEVSGGYGHFGMQNDTELHFGLGDVCQVDRVTATAPGGRRAEWGGVVGNQRTVLSF